MPELRRRSESAFLTPARAAELLGVHPETVARWVDAGRLKGYRTLGGHRRVDAADIASVCSGRRRL